MPKDEDITDWGIVNTRLAKKVMTTRKCQCQPKKECPCDEFIDDNICVCGVFYNMTDIKETKSLHRIMNTIEKKISEIKMTLDL